MTKIDLNVGDILENRDSRRAGKQIKVLSITDSAIRVENYRNADNAILNSVGKQYDIKTSRILSDYRVVQSAVQPELMPRPEEESKEVFVFIPDAEVPLTPEEEEEAASLAKDNLESSQMMGDTDFTTARRKANNFDIYREDDLGTPSVFTQIEEDDDEITPEQEADLHEALKSVGYYKLPDKEVIHKDIMDAISDVEEAKGTELDLDLSQVIDLVYETIKVDN